MNTWAPLWSGIVESSLWEESGDVVKVFMTMLARKDYDHVCRLDAYKIHRLCNLDELKVLDILKVLASPDKRRKANQEFDGRRIKAVEDGWLVLNGEKYRAMVQLEMKRSRDRKAQKAWRERQKKLQDGSVSRQTMDSRSHDAKLRKQDAANDQALKKNGGDHEN